MDKTVREWILSHTYMSIWRTWYNHWIHYDKNKSCLFNIKSSYKGQFVIFSSLFLALRQLLTVAIPGCLHLLFHWLTSGLSFYNPMQYQYKLQYFIFKLSLFSSLCHLYDLIMVYTSSTIKWRTKFSSGNTKMQTPLFPTKSLTCQQKENILEP